MPSDRTDAPSRPTLTLIRTPRKTWGSAITLEPKAGPKMLPRSDAMNAESNAEPQRESRMARFHRERHEYWQRCAKELNDEVRRKAKRVLKAKRDAYLTKNLYPHEADPNRRDPWMRTHRPASDNDASCGLVARYDPTLHNGAIFYLNDCEGRELIAAHVAGDIALQDAVYEALRNIYRDFAPPPKPRLVQEDALSP